MKKLVLIGLMAALSSANVLALTPQLAAPAVTLAALGSTSMMKGDINCGFICDSFGRCRRVCW